MTTMQKVLLGIFLTFSVLFISLLPLRPYPGNFVIKALPAICLSMLAISSVEGLRGRLLFASLLSCAAADVALELEAERYFVIGLGLFLIAHVLLIVTFSRDFKMQKSRIPIVVILVAYAVIMSVVLTPWLKEMSIPVYAYITAITLMGIFAALRAAKNKFALYGAISFIISDSFIAINKFMIPVPSVDYPIMVTYYLALFLIVYGLLKE